MLCAKLFCERLFIFSARDGNGFKPHLSRKLNAQMAEPSESEDGDKVAGPRAAISQCIERGDPRAEERSRIRGGNRIGNPGQSRGGNKHEIGIAPVAGDTCDLPTFAAGHKIASAAGIAIAAMPAVPTYSDAFSCFPTKNAWA